MSNLQRGLSQEPGGAQEPKRARQALFFMAVGFVLILGGVVSLIWMSWQTAVPQPTTNAYGVPALAQKGGTATEFSLGSLQGQNIALSDYRGEVVIMNFWATWCPPCRAEMPDLNRFYEAHQADGLVILAINEEESAATVRPFITANQFTFPVLLDLDGRVAQQYSTRSFPTTFVIDRWGVIQHVQTGIISESELEAVVLPLLQ